MRVKSVLFSLLVVVAFIGFVSVGITHAALDFVDLTGTWFEVKVSETGIAGPIVPPGGGVVTNNEKKATTYLLVDTLEITTTTYDVVYCTFNGSVWTRQINLEWPVLGGEPENFFTLFDFSYQDAQASTQTYWIPLSVTASEKTDTVGDINSASFKNIGGGFIEARVAESGVGSVKFTGSFIKSDQVVKEVPVGCRTP